MRLDASQLGRLKRRLTGFAISSGLPRADAEDCAQETFLVLAQKYPDKDEADTVPLAFKIIRWKIWEHRRRKSNVLEASNPRIENTESQDWNFAGTPGANANLSGGVEEVAALREAVYGTLGQIGTKCRQMLLWHLEGYSGAEIARKAGLGTRNAAYVAIYRCKKRFREKYEAFRGHSRLWRKD